MDAMAAQGTSGTETVSRLRSAVFALGAVSLMMGVPAAAQEPIPAVWKVREVDFLYRSSIAIFSCSALQGRIATILRAVGARDDVQVRVSNCDELLVAQDMDMDMPRTGRSAASDGWTRHDRFSSQRNNSRTQQARAHIRLLMPTEVTPAVLAEIDKDKGRRELISRVTRNPAAKYDDPIVFMAQRQSVTLSRSSIGLEPAECELLDQMSTSVLRQLGVRVTRRASCNTRELSHIPPQLTVETLVWTGVADGSVLQTPAAENDKSQSAPVTSAAPPVEPGTPETPK